MDRGQPPLTSVRLTRKYAQKIDGVDLSRNQVGDLLNLSAEDARMLIAEGWAAPCERGRTEDEHAGKAASRDPESES
jgi:hypothetical protein